VMLDLVQRQYLHQEPILSLTAELTLQSHEWNHNKLFLLLVRFLRIQ
jgi:hypothetical protein